MSGQKGTRKGKGKGSQVWRSKGKGKGEDAAEADGPIEKIKPTFTKLKDVRPGGRSYDLVVQVGDVTLESSREERRRAGNTVNVKCTEAIVGDETGCILLVTRQQDQGDILVKGARLALLNVKMRRVQDSFWIDVDNWSAIKQVDQCKDLLPENFDLSFELNSEIDRSKKIPPKPVFCDIDALEPEKKGINLICKVLEVKIEERSRVDGTSTKIAEATVGDAKGCSSLVARGPQVELLTQGAVLVILNAHIEMFNKAFIRLVADRWSDIKPLDAVNKDLLPEGHLTADTTVEEKNNKSKIEWVLVDG